MKKRASTNKHRHSDLWDHLHEVMDNQKCGLTSFIWSKVNVQNNKKHVSGRDVVQKRVNSLGGALASKLIIKNQR